MAGLCSVQATATTPGLTPCAAADLAQQFHQAQVAAQARLVEFDVSPPPVVCGKHGNALRSHLAGQHAGKHGRIVDDADVVGLGEGQNLRFNWRGAAWNKAAAGW